MYRQMPKPYQIPESLINLIASNHNLKHVKTNGKETDSRLSKEIQSVTTPITK